QLSTHDLCQWVTTLLAVLSLLSYCSRAHRDLHSFPTRRSSDLTEERQTSSQEQKTFIPRFRAFGRTASRMSRFPCSRARVSFRRSEEHTSELQSRVDLVCRLLLEKKN